MRKTMGTVAALALSLCVLVGCGSTATNAPTANDESAAAVATKQTATDDVEFNGKTVSVCVDVSDGWSVEFTTAGTVYLYDGEVTDDSVQIANGFLIDQKEYEENLADYQANDKSFTEVGGGFIAEDGARYAFAVGEDVFYLIQVDTYDHPDADCDQIFSRFAVSVEE
jgi:hypothetical protein